jgi:exonuclease-1
MGISGLLPLLKACMTERHISELRGKRVAVDGYAWLHKGTYGCCVDLACGKENFSWIKYCLYYIDMLLSFNIHVTMVFDGADLPAKRVTEVERRSKRQQALAQAQQFTRDKDHKSARNWYTRAVDVTPLMAAQFIAVLRDKYPTVNVIVAPYEADAQLAYLSKHDLVDIIISEDSDTVAYHCKEILFKLDQNGTCQHLVTSKIYELPEFAHFTPDMMTLMCIAAGCDYLPSVKGFALKTSLKFIEKFRSVGLLLRAMRLENLLPLNFAHSANPAYPPSLLEYELEFFKVRNDFLVDLSVRISILFC